MDTLFYDNRYVVRANRTFPKEKKKINLEDDKPIV